MFSKLLPWLQGSRDRHGVRLGPTGPMWAPCWPHELCYLGRCNRIVYLLVKIFSMLTMSMGFLTDDISKSARLLLTERRRLMGIRIPVINLKRCEGRLSFIMGNPIPITPGMFLGNGGPGCNYIKVKYWSKQERVKTTFVWNMALKWTSHKYVILDIGIRGSLVWNDCIKNIDAIDSSCLDCLILCEVVSIIARIEIMWWWCSVSNWLHLSRESMKCRVKDIVRNSLAIIRFAASFQCPVHPIRPQEDVIMAHTYVYIMKLLWIPTIPMWYKFYFQ